MITILSAVVAPHEITGWDQFVAIISKPDNMPVAGALLLVLVFTVISLRQAFFNDRLIAEDRKDEILSHMQE